jgi:hypothetical protein
MELFRSRYRTEYPYDIPIREYVERLLLERDKLHTALFEDIRASTTLLIQAQKEAVAAAFAASEKAIAKAEEAQQAYNERSNEFRGQLDDQAKLLMPRAETLSLLKAMDEKIEAMRLFLDSKLEAQRLSFESTQTNAANSIAEIRSLVAALNGQGAGAHNIWAYIVGGVGILSFLVTLVLQFVHATG